MPTSPRESEIGLPTLRVSIRASSSPCSSTSVASRRNSRTRSPGATARQPGNAARARATVASVSSMPTCSSSTIGSSVAGLTTAKLATLEEPLPLVAGDDLVEQPLLRAPVVEVVVDDLVAERRTCHRPRLQRRDGLAQRRREPLRVGLVRVPLERRRELELVPDPQPP